MRILKTLLISSIFYSNSVLASDIVSCEKNVRKLHIIECKSKKFVEVSLLSVNGGVCIGSHFHWSGRGKFTIPEPEDCDYVRSITLSINGVDKIFAPL